MLYISIFTAVSSMPVIQSALNTAVMLVLGDDFTSLRQFFFCSCLSSSVYFSYFKLSFILPLMHVRHCRLTADLKCMLTLFIYGLSSLSHHVKHLNNVSFEYEKHLPIPCVSCFRADVSSILSFMD